MSPGQSTHTRTMAAIVVHAVAVLYNRQALPLLQPFNDMLKRPETLAVSVHSKPLFMLLGWEPLFM